MLKEMFLQVNQRMWVERQERKEPSLACVGARFACHSEKALALEESAVWLRLICCRQTADSSLRSEWQTSRN